MDGRLHVYRRDGSRYWQCSTYLGGRNLRTTTKEENAVLAKEFATFWFMERFVEAHRSRMTPPSVAAQPWQSQPAPAPSQRAPTAKGKTVREAAVAFLAEYQVITEGERSESYVKSHEMRLNRHLLPYFGDMQVADVNGGMMQEYRVHRIGTAKNKRRPARNTLHLDTVTLRLVLKTAQRHGWIPQVPDISPPYKKSGKIGHRGWFSASEYKRLYQATRELAKNPTRERWRSEYEDLHDFVLFMANTGLRPDEATRLQYRDVTVTKDKDSHEIILHIAVRGKRGVGHCKSMPGAVRPFQRLKKRHCTKPTDILFGRSPRLLNKVLDQLDLKTDRDGNVRTAYSLRHTYICLRLIEGADIYQIAKNCRTSVKMIQEFYAVHLKDTIDASAVNVRKTHLEPRRKSPSSAPRSQG